MAAAVLAGGTGRRESTAEETVVNALRRFGGLSHGFWLDGLSREVIEDGSLARRIREEGLFGVTTRGRVSGGGAAPQDVEAGGEPTCEVATRVTPSSRRHSRLPPRDPTMPPTMSSTGRCRSF
jgi:hypothetical protein